MTRDMRFIRLASTDVLVQVHASPDSRILLLPLIENSQVTGWLVYDTNTGELACPEKTPDMPEDYSDGVWRRPFQARQWATDRYYQEG